MGQVGQFWNMGSDIWLHLPFRLEERYPCGADWTYWLSSAKIFTDLTEMKKGDFFFIHVLDKKLAYRVDQITVVEPQDTKELQIMEGKDLVTLVTCTPYGVNDKRLLVRGVRTAYHAKEEEIRARNHHSQWMEVYKRAIFAGLLIICVLIATRKVYEKMKRKSGERRYG